MRLLYYAIAGCVIGLALWWVFDVPSCEQAFYASGPDGLPTGTPIYRPLEPGTYWRAVQCGTPITKGVIRFIPHTISLAQAEIKYREVA